MILKFSHFNTNWKYAKTNYFWDYKLFEYDLFFYYRFVEN